MSEGITNVVIAGLGGQGVLTCSDILAEAAFLADLDVKKAEVHGMSQRGGSLSSDVRFGERVAGPMVPAGEADFLLVLSEDQVEVWRHRLREGGCLLTPALFQDGDLPDKRSLNVAMLGALSARLGGVLGQETRFFDEAVTHRLAPKLHEANRQAFAVGRSRSGGAV